MPKDWADRAIMFSVIAIVAWAIIGLPAVKYLEQTPPNYREQPAKAPQENGRTSQAFAKTVAKEKQPEGQKEGKWYSTFLNHAPDWFVAIFTGLLVYVTYRLVKSTNKLWEAGERQIAIAKQAADAATLSAKAAIGMELPIIRTHGNVGLIRIKDNLEQSDFPKIFRSGGVYSTGTPGKNNILVGIDFKNHGRTTAFPTKIDVGWIVEATIPPEPNYFVSAVFPPTAIIKEGDDVTSAPRIEKIVELSESDQSALTDGTKILWVYASLHYRDFMNLPHEARFCWRSRTGVLGRANNVPDAYTSGS